MREEPDIVRILREEERLGRLRTKLFENTEDIPPLEPALSDDSQPSVISLPSPQNTKHTSLNEAYADAIWSIIYHDAPIAFLIFDEQERLISWNAYAEYLLGDITKKFLRHAMKELYPPDEWLKLQTHLTNPPGLRQQNESKIYTSTNQLLEISLSLCILRDTHKRPLGTLHLFRDITTEKQMAQQLNAITEYGEDCICVMDRQSQYLTVNDQTLAHLGCTRDEVIGKPFSSFHTQKETREFCEKLDWVLEHGQPLKDIYHKHAKWFLRIFCPFKETAETHPSAVLVVLRDITEEKKLRELLKEKEKDYRMMVECSPQLIFIVDAKGTISDVNMRITEWLGYQPQGTIGKNLLSSPFFTEETRAQLKKIFLKKPSGTSTSLNHVEMLTNHGEKRLGIIHTKPLKNDHHKVMGYLLAVSELTPHIQRAKAIEEFSESEKKYRVILENSLYMIYQLNLKNKTYDYISPSSTKILGYSPQEMASFGQKQIEDMIHPEDRERVRQHLRELLETTKTTLNGKRVIEYRFMHKTLGYRWISDTCSIIANERNEPIALIGNIEDITERKKIWDSLAKSEEKYRILAETSADGVFTTDVLGRLTYINPSIEKMLGKRKSQILATPFRKYLLEDSIYFFQQVFIDVRQKNEKIENVDLEIVTEDGTIIPIEVNMAPLEKQEEFSGVVCTVRNITQRREIEDELKKNERLKTEFMNIAAHELRSPVTPIKGYLDLIIHDNEVNEKIKNWAKISLRNAERLLKLVNDILDVARLDSDTMRFDMEKIDPIELLTEIAEDAKPAIINKKLEFRVNVPDSLPHLLGDKNRLSQVFKNLIGNALKFTDNGYIELKAEKKDNYLIFSVTDTGIGISKDELKKIFTKFYQAYTGEDRNNEGTGLGLFISKEIVKKHNGSIWGESEVGKGSRFVVELPYIYKMTVDFST